MAATCLRAIVLGAGCVLALCGVGDAPLCPAITSVSLTPDDIHSGDEVTAMIRTSDDATSVIAYVHRHAIPVPQIAAGVFSGQAVIPRIPRFIHLHLPVTFTASNAAGAESSQTITVRIN